MLSPVLEKNDRKAAWIIWVVSAVVFTAVALLSKLKLHITLGFDVHLFALFNAIINSIVTVLLIAGLIAVKRQQYLLHKKIMLFALLLSVLFIVSYICHHLLSR